MENSAACSLGVCDGTGFLFIPTQILPAPCKCVRRNDSLQTRQRFLGERFYKIRMEDIEPRTDKQTMLKKFLLAHPGQAIFLTGTGDRGKTHFLAAMYNYWDDRGEPTRYLDDGMLKDELRQAELDGNYRCISDMLKHYKYIFLDDVNKEKVSDFYRGALYRLFNELYKNKRHIFITANDSLRTLGSAESWGPSVARRVEDLCEIVEF